MSLRSGLLIHGLVLSLSLAASICSARAEEKEKELPKSGSLSVSSSGGGPGVSAPGGWGDSDGLGAGGAPISGSVSRINPSTWQLFVQNSSDDTYSVNLEVIQKDDRGSRVKVDSFSYNLKPHAQQRRSVSAASSAATGELNLRNWRNVSKQKADKEKARAASIPVTPAAGTTGKAPVPGSN